MMLRIFSNKASRRTILCGLACTVFLATPVLAQEGGLPRAAQAYADQYKVSRSEAVRRLELQATIGELEERLATQEAATFAGLYIEHKPSFRVIARFTKDAPATLARYTQDTEIVAASAEQTWAQLRQTQSTVTAAIRALGVGAESAIDVVAGRVKIYALDPAKIELARTAGTLQLASFVDVLKAPRLSQREATIEGGRTLNNGDCTTAFTVRNSSGTRYMLTAGHCGAPLSYLGVTLPQAGINFRVGSAYDYQWLNTPTFTRPVNNIYEGLSSYTPITSVRTYAQISVGNWVCKYGATTAYTCGSVVSKSYDLDGSATFVQLHNSSLDAYGGYNISSPGDSGGPYFNGNTAFGLHVASADAVDPNDSVFMPISYISASGLTVLTAP